MTSEKTIKRQRHLPYNFLQLEQSDDLVKEEDVKIF